MLVIDAGKLKEEISDIENHVFHLFEMALVVCR